LIEKITVTQLYPPIPFIRKIIVPFEASAKKSSPALKLRRAMVELAGVEPASKQVTKVLSTCLDYYWLSGETRKQSPKFHRIL